MITWVPEREADREDVRLPVVEVTVLEDRAVVRRSGIVKVAGGTSRLRVEGVAPVLQDVSLRAEVASGGRVTDARVRRAIRIRREDRPAEVAALEQRIRDLLERFGEASERRGRAEDRLESIADMLSKGAEEIPDDAAWGIVDPEAWSQTLHSLFQRRRELSQTALDAYHAQLDLRRDLEQLAQQRRALETPSNDLVAWAELDVVADAGEVTLELQYTVPNAMWRPIHRAVLTGTELAFTARAAIWQNTGEDWTDAQLVLSTARASLGTEPPLLSDDLLRAERKSDEVRVEAREVAIDRASGGGGGGASDGVELPGVDDGGEVQNLRPDGPCTVASTGRPVFVDVFGFAGPAEVSRVSMPELAARVFLKCVGTHGGKAPVLAGPVELVRDSGTVGWTEVLYVAPGARFELGFGPDDAVRVVRSERVVSERQDPVDKWTRRLTQLELYVSNLGDAEKTVRFTERVPVSEIEHVKIALDDKRTSGAPTLDDNGFVSWDLSLKPHARERLRLGWELALAPDVKGL